VWKTGGILSLVTGGSQGIQLIHMNDHAKTPESCPVCGADVPPGARACPECGADENAGWNEESAVYDGIDLPDEEFNYDDFVKREFEGKPRLSGRSGWNRLIGILLLLALALVFIVRFVL